jgi:hypothetical protein
VSETNSVDLIVAVSEAAANAIEHPVSPRENLIEVEMSIDHDGRGDGSRHRARGDSGRNQGRPVTAG